MLPYMLAISHELTINNAVTYVTLWQLKAFLIVGYHSAVILLTIDFNRDKYWPSLIFTLA